MTTTELERDLADVAARLRRSTVAVRAGHGRGSGSGVVWHAAGTIVTNAHVATTPRVEIELADGRRVPGTIERRDERRDLAAIRVDASDLTAATVRDPGDLRAGEVLVAFGHPLGVANVLTTGIAYTGYGGGERRFVTADVRLAPGNSGGPLADARGRVVGINSMVAGGLALAVPSDVVQRFLGEALDRPRLGIRLAPARLNDGRSAYAIVGLEPDGRGARAGLLPGDVLLTRDPARLGGMAGVDVLRGGRQLRIAIGDRSEASAAA